MNQILYEDIGNNPQTDIKKIVRFYGIAILVFGLALIGFGIFGIFQWLQGAAPSTRNKPQIVANVIDGKYVKIEVDHDKALDKIIYRWNDEPEKTEVGRGNTFEYLLNMPNGVNTLTITAIDNIGIEATHTGTYSFNNGVDIQNPKIEFSAVESENIIHVKAIDETEIAYITYRWNNDEEQKYDKTDESKTIIDTTIPLPSEAGDYELTIVAVDKNNNKETKVEKVKGLKKPVIQKPTQYGEKLTVTVTDEQGLDTVIIKVNDKSFKWVSDTDNKTDFVSTVNLSEGENKITIMARNKSGLVADEMRVKCTYNP